MRGGGERRTCHAGEHVCDEACLGCRACEEQGDEDEEKCSLAVINGVDTEDQDTWKMEFSAVRTSSCGFNERTHIRRRRG